MLAILETLAQKHLNLDIENKLHTLNGLKYSNGSLLEYNNNYMQLILSLVRTGRFKIDDTAKINYLTSLGSHDFVMKVRIFHVENGYANYSLQEIQSHVYRVFLLSYPSGSIPTVKAISQNNNKTPDTENTQ